MERGFASPSANRQINPAASQIDPKLGFRNFSQTTALLLQAGPLALEIGARWVYSFARHWLKGRRGLTSNNVTKPALCCLIFIRPFRKVSVDDPLFSKATWDK